MVYVYCFCLLIGMYFIRRKSYNPLLRELKKQKIDILRISIVTDKYNTTSALIDNNKTISLFIDNLAESMEMDIDSYLNKVRVISLSEKNNEVDNFDAINFKEEMLSLMNDKTLTLQQKYLVQNIFELQNHVLSLKKPLAYRYAEVREKVHYCIVQVPIHKILYVHAKISSYFNNHEMEAKKWNVGKHTYFITKNQCIETRYYEYSHHRAVRLNEVVF